MTTVKDIAKIIANKYKLSNVEAEIFMQMIVEVINDGLLKDRQVKIKGFGTFKIQAVKERSSVNVNTGEKVIIAEHDKISFTPDAVMKDLINKPFAQFETVMVEDDSPLLKDNVDFCEDNQDASDASAEQEVVVIKTEQPAVTTEKTAEDEKAVTTEEPNKDDNTENASGNIPENATAEESVKADASSETLNNEDANPQEVTATQKESAVSSDEEKHDKVITVTADKTEKGQQKEAVHEPEPAQEQKTEQVVTPEPQHEAEQIHEQDVESEQCERQYSKCRNIFVYYGVLINIIVAIVAFALGYCASSGKWFVNDETVVVQIQEKAKVVKTTPKAKPAPKQTVQPIKSDSIENKKETVNPNAQDTKEPVINKKEDTSKQKETNKPTVKEEQVDAPLHAYDSDVRVKTGAYYIMGTEKTVTVKSGQTLTSISRTYLGDGMECYVEAYNGKKEVKQGDKIKIPKLKLKKLVNRKK